MRPGLFLASLILLASLRQAGAGPGLDSQNPTGFFTNVASRLLASELNVSLTHIAIYPTNQYTPAVHRLLQVAANLHDATSTDTFPTVFRPLFSRDADGLGTNVFISGYINVPSVTGPNDSQFAFPMDASDLAATNIAVTDWPVNVFGVPWIIGAKKGFPNFNELDMDNSFQLTRKLQVTRPIPTAPITSYSYNQMYLLNLTSQLGVECWNSYTNSYTNGVTIFAQEVLRNLILTNDEGFSTNWSFVTSADLIVPVWPGYNPNDPLSIPASFQIPLNTTIAAVPLSIYRFNADGSPYLTTNLALPYETNLPPDIPGYPYPQPHWWLMVTNELRVIMLDTSVNPNRVIDYVQLRGMNSFRDLYAEVQTLNTSPYTGFNGLWMTNYNTQGSPYGLGNQVGVSLGVYGLGGDPSAWGTLDRTALTNEINVFRVFFHLPALPPFQTSQYGWVNSTNNIQAPYTPIATNVQHISWQVNDPLVHYLASDLIWSGASHIDHIASPLTNENLAFINQRYMPWGGNPILYGADQNPCYLGIKDPLMRKSDNWDFPTNESLSPDWLGRVHRGTPWQTIYLKASDILSLITVIGTPPVATTNYIGLNTWTNWTGDADPVDAAAMAPVRDWHLVSVLAGLLNTNDVRSALSVNTPDPGAWQVALDGLVALTNDLPDSQLILYRTPDLAPLFVSSNSPQASAIAGAIQLARGNQPGGVFRGVGDLLAVLQLTEQSPFLNISSGVQLTNGISDQAYEMLPSQLLSLVRPDSIGSIAPANGTWTVQFTGYDSHAYAVQSSSNLVDWTNLGTNVPVCGGFGFTNAVAPGTGRQFYRSVLVQ